MHIDSLKKFKIPNSPGVYFFLKGKDILYIGKATTLKSRVRSYFLKDLVKTRGPILVDMLLQADHIKWQETDSVLEALVLESKLIRRYQPKANTKDKDDKSFSYVVITKEKLPRVLVMRGKDLETHKNFPDPTLRIDTTFGPYTNGRQLKDGLQIIRRIFPFLDGKFENHYAFYRQVDLVPDVTTPEGIQKYKKDIKNIKLFFDAKKKTIVKTLEKEMKALAKAHEFEKAGEKKRQLFALKYINDTILIRDDIGVPEDTVFRIEAYDIAHMSGKNMVGVMTVVENNTPSKNDYRKFKIRTQEGANDTGALVEVIDRRLNHPEWKFPNLIVVDGSVAQINAAEALLRERGVAIDVVSVVKDERHKPKALRGKSDLVEQYKSSILLANSEAHRFAITYHKNMRGKIFLNLKSKPKQK